MTGKFLLFGGDEIENSLIRFVDRKIGEQRRGERRLAEQRTTKHRFQARKSCIADARNYRIARRLPVRAVAQFDWKAPIPPAGLIYSGSVGSRNFETINSSTG
jgi:hypothetical protein